MNQPTISLPRRSSALALLLLAPLIGSSAIAETVYVTDELRLGLYQGEETSGRPFKTLISGDALEVLERALMSIRVRTEDGEEGWVKTAYIVTVEPGRRRAEKLEAQNTQLQVGLTEARTEIVSAQSRIEALEVSLTRANAGIEERVNPGTGPDRQPDSTKLGSHCRCAGSDCRVCGRLLLARS
jgi:SH3-like domain-containing protein